MLLKVLILPVLCALAVAFPLLPPESTTDLLEWIRDLGLTTDGEVASDQDSVADLDQTTDLESTTDPYLDVMQTSKFYVDFETATASSVEEASETPDDYNTFQTESFVSKDFGQSSTSAGSNESTSLHLYAEISYKTYQGG